MCNIPLVTLQSTWKYSNMTILEYAHNIPIFTFIFYDIHRARFTSKQICHNKEYETDVSTTTPYEDSCHKLQSPHSHGVVKLVVQMKFFSLT
jgi:hypothetical protein